MTAKAYHGRRSRASVRTVEPSVEVAVAKMRAAADKHLGDRSCNERQAWAEAQVADYIKRGTIIIEGEAGDRP